VAPAVLQAGKKYPFRTSERIYPVYLHYPYQRVDEVTLQAPPGYRVEALPEARKEEFAFGSYEVTYQDQSSAIHCERRFQINGIVFPLQSFSALRLFFDKTRGGDEQQAVLRAQQEAAISK
jgi:hypothetical protein